MAVVRITIARPRTEVQHEVEQYFRELIDRTSRMPGFLSGYVLQASGASGEVGRVTIWESQEAANRAANDPRVMAIHARLIPDNPEHLQDWDMTTSLIVEGPAQGSRV